MELVLQVARIGEEAREEAARHEDADSGLVIREAWPGNASVRFVEPLPHISKEFHVQKWFVINAGNP